MKEQNSCHIRFVAKDFNDFPKMQEIYKIFLALQEKYGESEVDIWGGIARFYEEVKCYGDYDEVLSDFRDKIQRGHVCDMDIFVRKDFYYGTDLKSTVKNIQETYKDISVEVFFDSIANTEKLSTILRFTCKVYSYAGEWDARRDRVELVLQRYLGRKAQVSSNLDKDIFTVTCTLRGIDSIEDYRIEDSISYLFDENMELLKFELSYNTVWEAKEDRGNSETISDISVMGKETFGGIKPLSL